MINTIDEFKNLSKEDQLKAGIVISYDRTVSAFVICELIYNYQIRFNIDNSELFTTFRNIAFTDLFNCFGILFSKSGRNDACSLDALNLSNDKSLENNYRALREIYEKEYKETRDKLTSHLDMVTLIDFHTRWIDFKEVENFLNSIKSFIIKAIPNYYDIFLIDLFDIDEKRIQYDAQIKTWLYKFLNSFGIY